MAVVRRVAQPSVVAATVLVLASAGAGPRSAAARSTRITMTMEAGPEVDSNVGRDEPGAGETAVTSALFRATSRVRATRRVGQNHALDLTLKGGARVFLEEAAREYDVGVLQALGQWAAQASVSNTLERHQCPAYLMLRCSSMLPLPCRS